MMPGFYPRTTPQSRSPPKRRIADLRFACLLDDDNDEASTNSSNNSSDDSLFLHLEEESLLDITRSEIVPPSPTTPSDDYYFEEDTDSHNLLGIIPLDKLQLQMPQLIDQQDITLPLPDSSTKENDRSNISPTTTAINLLFTKADNDDTKSTTDCSSFNTAVDTSARRDDIDNVTLFSAEWARPSTTISPSDMNEDTARLNNRQSYTNNLDISTDTINYPIQVEMAKSAFLNNPTPELWNELVSCFRYMMFIKNNNHNSLQNDLCLEEEVNGSIVEFSSDERDGQVNVPFDLTAGTSQEDEGWASFDDEKDDLMNSTSKVSTARLPTVDTGNVEEHHHHEPTSFEFIGNVEINEVLSTIIPKEEKAMFNHFFPEMSNEKNRNTEDAWSEERDVSPPTLPGRSRDECSSSDYDPDLISLGQSESSQEEDKESTTSQLNESIESSEASYVLNEVSHWENRIDKYDQWYVNVVAAALEEATGENANITEGEWMDGQILEVPPVDDEEVLYIV